jgi:hypothetical protein
MWKLPNITQVNLQVKYARAVTIETQIMSLGKHVHSVCGPLTKPMVFTKLGSPEILAHNDCFGEALSGVNLALNVHKYTGGTVHPPLCCK